MTTPCMAVWSVLLAVSETNYHKPEFLCCASLEDVTASQSALVPKSRPECVWRTSVTFGTRIWKLPDCQVTSMSIRFKGQHCKGKWPTYVVI